MDVKQMASLQFPEKEEMVPAETGGFMVGFWPGPCGLPEPESR
jgi:hypothetical protein